jgi:uncharacterized membrane protein YkoI
MKPLPIIAACILACGAPMRAAESEVTTLDTDVPAKVKEAISRHTAGQEVIGIEREVDDGLVTYTARIKQRGLDRRLTVTADGAVVSDRRFDEINRAVAGIDERRKRATNAMGRAADAVTGEGLSLEQLPAPARERIDREADGHDIARVEGDVEEGKLYYRATIRYQDGSERRIHVTDRGELLSQK